MGGIRRAKHILGGRRETRATFSLIVTALFVVAVSIVHGFHEFWRDELHCWSVGRTADGLVDLLTGARRYDGHPFLWYYLLHLASRVCRSAAGLHVVTIALAGGSCFLWLRCSGLPRFLRLLFPFTYLFFYEYGVMSRSYTLGIFLMFLFAALYRRERTGFVLPAFVLALLGMTSVYGTILSTALAVVLFSCGWKQTGAESTLPAVRLPRSWFVGLAVWIAGLLLTMVTSSPPDDAFFDYPWHFNFSAGDITEVAGRIWYAFLPYRVADLDARPVVQWLAIGVPGAGPWLPRLGLVLVALLALSFARSWRTVVSFGLGLTAMGLFQQAKYPGALRHWGHNMVFAVVCAWIFQRDTRGRRSSLLTNVLLTGIFLVQCAATIRVIPMEIARPFSGALEAARFIRSRGWRNALLVGTNDHAASAVAGYLDRPFWSADSGELGHFVVFHNGRHEATAGEALALTSRLLARGDRSEAILILNFAPTVAPTFSGLRVEPLLTTRPAVMPDEQFSLFRVSRAR